MYEIVGQLLKVGKWKECGESTNWEQYRGSGNYNKIHWIRKLVIINNTADRVNRNNIVDQRNGNNALANENKIITMQWS